jgi:hypothetical protein
LRKGVLQTFRHKKTTTFVILSEAIPPVTVRHSLFLRRRYGEGDLNADIMALPKTHVIDEVLKAN